MRRVQLSLLDRLMDDAPDDPRDPGCRRPTPMLSLRNAVRRDLEALLNARRPLAAPASGLSRAEAFPARLWHPGRYRSRRFTDPRRREACGPKSSIPIRRFEPRLQLRVTIADSRRTELEATLRLRIEAMLRAEPAPEPIAFDTLVDAHRRVRVKQALAIRPPADDV